MSESPEDIQKHVKTYMKVGAFLLFMTVVTVLLSFHDFGGHGNMIVGMAVAALKSSAVALIFMHLNHERPLIYKILLFAVAFVTVMFILFSFTQGDGLHMPGFEHHAVVEQQG